MADFFTRQADPTPDETPLPECEHVRTGEHVLPPVACLPQADPDMFELRPPCASEPRDVSLFGALDEDPIF